MNRSYLFSLDVYPDGLKTHAVPLSESKADIPLIYRILVSQNPRVSQSILFGGGGKTAITADYEAGVDQLSIFFALLPDEYQEKAGKVISFLRSQKSAQKLIHLECAEIFEMADGELEEQNAALVAELSDIDMQIADALNDIEHGDVSDLYILDEEYWSNVLAVMPSEAGGKKDEMLGAIFAESGATVSDNTDSAEKSDTFYYTPASGETPDEIVRNIRKQLEAAKAGGDIITQIVSGARESAAADAGGSVSQSDFLKRDDGICATEDDESDAEEADNAAVWQGNAARWWEHDGDDDESDESNDDSDESDDFDDDDETDESDESDAPEFDPKNPGGRYRNIDVFMAEPELYRKRDTGEKFGGFILREGVVTGLPIAPEDMYAFNNDDEEDEELPDWRLFLHDGEGYECVLDYHRAIRALQFLAEYGEKYLIGEKDGYVVTTPLTREELRTLSNVVSASESGGEADSADDSDEDGDGEEEGETVYLNPDDDPNAPYLTRLSARWKLFLPALILLPFYSAANYTSGLINMGAAEKFSLFLRSLSLSAALFSGSYIAGFFLLSLVPRFFKKKTHAILKVLAIFCIIDILLHIALFLALRGKTDTAAHPCVFGFGTLFAIFAVWQKKQHMFRRILYASFVILLFVCWHFLGIAKGSAVFVAAALLAFGGICLSNALADSEKARRTVRRFWQNKALVFLLATALSLLALLYFSSWIGFNFRSLRFPLVAQLGYYAALFGVGYFCIRTVVAFAESDSGEKAKSALKNLFKRMGRKLLSAAQSWKGRLAVIAAVASFAFFVWWLDFQAGVIMWAVFVVAISILIDAVHAMLSAAGDIIGDKLAQDGISFDDSGDVVVNDDDEDDGTDDSAKDFLYSGSDDVDRVAWHLGNSGHTLHEVMQKEPNDLGLYDMSGNVTEWCWDWYGGYDYRELKNPHGSGSGSARVGRGGNWFNSANCCRVAFRYAIAPKSKSDFVGFRVVKNAGGLSPKKLDFVLVEGGLFFMGSEYGTGDEAEHPEQTVSVDSFYMCIHPVTQEEYADTMGKNPSQFKKGGSYPVETVSWFDAVCYCNMISLDEGLDPCYYFCQPDSDGALVYPYSAEEIPDGAEIACDWKAEGYRLPTEAEWEYAARGGNRH